MRLRRLEKEKNKKTNAIFQKDFPQSFPSRTRKSSKCMLDQSWLFTGKDGFLPDRVKTRF